VEALVIEPREVVMGPELFWPKNVRPSAVPLVIVCGPPAAGKSTYVASRRQPGDIVIDLDLIVMELGGDSRTTDRAIRKRALMERNNRLRLLHTRESGRAWFITTAPSGSTRRQWSRLLKPECVLLMPTPADECLRRVGMDPERSASRAEQTRIIEYWWAEFSPWIGDTIYGSPFTP
jgi:predicted kinase